MEWVIGNRLARSGDEIRSAATAFGRGLPLRSVDACFGH